MPMFIPLRVALLALPLALPTAEARSLTLSLPDYPSYMGEQLVEQGILTRVVQTVFQGAGIAIKLVAVPNNRAIEGARNGLYDGSLGWARTPEREADLYYSAPVMSLRMVFCQRRGENYRWSKLADLAPYRLGVTRGNFYSSDFDALVSASTLLTDVANSDVENLRKLLARRIDLLPIDAEVGPFLIQTALSTEQSRQLICPPQAYWSAPLHVVLTRQHPGNAALLRRFDARLASMRASGELEKLIAATREAVIAAQRPH